jgi:ribosomal protein S18 acetylase RimI-like enzyme
VIKEIKDFTELTRSVQVLRDSYMTVASEFKLTRENCPTNAAFITFEQLKHLMERGAEFFGWYDTNKLIGCVAIEHAGEQVYYMEKLAVLPEYRHRGYGRGLADFVYSYVKEKKGERISIGIIDGNRLLKEWYKKQGYVEKGIKEFNHLPFTVCFMERDVCP